MPYALRVHVFWPSSIIALSVCSYITLHLPQVSERCDVWSMGVVMWEMYTLEVPYNEQSAQQILAALMDGSIHLHIPSACEPEWRSLIEMCMDTNPDARPSFRLLVSHLDAMLRQMGC